MSIDVVNVTASSCSQDWSNQDIGKEDYNAVRGKYDQHELVSTSSANWDWDKANAEKYKTVKHGQVHKSCK